MTFGERLIELRKSKNLTREVLAEQLGISKYTLRNYELSVNEPGSTLLIRVSDFFDVSIDYLMGMTDEKEKVLPYNLKTSEFEHIKKYRELDALGQEHVNNILEWESQRIQMLADMQKQLADSKIVEFEPAPRITYTLPYLRKMASAGRGEYLFDSLPTDTIDVPACELSEKADFVIGVNGDSMEPTYYDGDMVYVEKSTEIFTGEIGIFITGNDCFIKEAGVDHLISHNKKYPDIYTDARIELLGRVLGKVEDV